MSTSGLIFGIYQVFIIVYVPLYNDIYASNNQKGMFMSLGLVAPPLGVVIGYVMTSYITNSHIGDWELSFVI